MSDNTRREGAYEARCAEDEFGDWLNTCGACDAGLQMDCICPQGDPRAVILALVKRVDGALALCNEVNPATGKRRSIVNPDRLRPVLLGHPDPFPRPTDNGTSTGADQ